MSTKKTGKPLSPDAAKVRAHLAAMTPEGARELTAKEYRSRTHHHVKDTIFNMEKTRLKRLAGVPVIPRKAGAPRPAKPAPAVGRPSRTVEILANVPLIEFPNVPVPDLIKFGLSLVSQVLRDSAVEVVALADPAVIEVRRRSAL